MPAMGRSSAWRTDLPSSFYQQLVELGGGLMLGKYMLAGWKNMHPAQHYIQDQIDLTSTSTTLPISPKKRRSNSWYENPIDLPGRWYLQVITQLFKENRLAKGEFVGLGASSTCVTSPVRLSLGRCR